MFLITLYSKPIPITFELPSQETVNQIMGHLSTHPIVALLEYTLQVNGANKTGNRNALREVQKGIVAKDFAEYRQKHPGGRPMKTTACKTCGKEHQSYTQARACCFLKRLGKE